MTHIHHIDPENTLEAYFLRIRVKSRVVYLTVAGLLILLILMLPVIKVSLSVQGRGIIRPVTEKAEIRAIRSEMVSGVYITEGQFVHKGDTLVSLRQELVENNLQYLQARLTDEEVLVSDLEQLISGGDRAPVSPLYFGQYTDYRKRLDRIDREIERAAREVERHRLLYEQELIAKRDFEDLEFDLGQRYREKQLITSGKIAGWRSDLTQCRRTVSNLKKQISELEKQQSLYTICAPVSGTVEEFSGIYTGTILQAGQMVAVISPHSEMLAEIYVSAKDIGHLYKGQTTEIQVDAYNYNEWGSIPGEIGDISNDFILADNTPVFLVKCHLSQNFLELSNGVKGELRKGMTVNARFMTARRSLLHLLYEKSDNWLNPTRDLTAERN